MRWEDGRRSENVDDRRRVTPKRVAGGGIGVVVIVLVAMFMGVDPTQLLQLLDQQSSSPQRQVSQSQRQSTGRSQEDVLVDFVSVVLADTEDTWKPIFAKMGKAYQEPKLVVFSGSVDSACGFAETAIGPFYCPRDQKVYIDLTFYRELQERFKAPGDFAQAYVIAHEVGHHVQNLFDILPKVHARKQKVSQAEANQLSVRLELQADCLAGLWANHADRARSVIEQGDIEEALNAASAIGDDRIQKQSRGYVVPDSFTHGSSAQRVYWFKQGLQKGTLSACNTFEIKQP